MPLLRRHPLLGRMTENGLGALHLNDLLGNISEEEEEMDHDGYDDNEYFPWFTEYSIGERRDVGGQERSVAQCSGTLIDPNMIRANFYDDMAGRSIQVLRIFAYTLFDRWGCLKEETWKHPIKRGSGVWGEELNQDATFFVYQRIWVDKDFLPPDTARVMCEQLWQAMTAKDSKCKFAFVRAQELQDTNALQPAGRPLGETENVYHNPKWVANPERFLRDIGFRRVGSTDWFCLAKNPSHRSRSLAADQDYDPPELQSTPDAIEFHMELFGLEDSACKKRLIARSVKRDPSLDSIWTALGDNNNNILHQILWHPIRSGNIVVRRRIPAYSSPLRSDRNTKPDSIRWLLSQPFAEPLLSAVNRYGETPVEKYQSYLEERRTHIHKNSGKHTSDLFSGHTYDEIKCLFLLQRRLSTTMKDSRLARYGCTCGSCEAGFLSPRMLFAMECASKQLVDTLEGALEWQIAACWVNFHKGVGLKYVDASLRQDMTTSKPMCHAFCTLLRYVATCCRSKKAPGILNIMDVLDGGNEQQPNARSFLEHGGTVSSAVLAVFDRVQEDHKYLGSGDHERRHKEKISKLKPCRNDLEVVFAGQQYQRLELGTW